MLEPCDTIETIKSERKPRQTSGSRKSSVDQQISHSTDCRLNKTLNNAIKEVDLMISFLSTTGKQAPQKVIKSILEKKHLFYKGELDYQHEADFWLYYNQLVLHLQPATLESIKEIGNSPLIATENAKVIKKAKRVPFYYGVGVCIMILMTVTLQTYYMIGVEVLAKTNQLFEKRNAIKLKLSILNDNVKEQKLTEIQQKTSTKLEDQYEVLDQEFDANRNILFEWNSFWRMGAPIEAIFSDYDEFRYNSKKNQIKSSSIDDEEKIPLLVKHEAYRKLNSSRSKYFRSKLSSGYVINLLEAYVLPLLFGCLGAFTLVLRSIYNAFKNTTFTLRSCQDYNLRIVLGAVTGISSGIFFSDSMPSESSQFSPMLIAFLIGYNVDILFSAMDSAANRLLPQKKSKNKEV